MGWLQRYRAERLVYSLLRSSREPGRRDVDRLRGLAPSAIPELLVAARQATTAEQARIRRLLAALMDKRTLPYYFRGLSDPSPQTVAVTQAALKEAPGLDPNPLVALLQDPDVYKPALIDVLASHRERLDVGHLLQHAARLEPGHRGSLFELIEAEAGPELIPELKVRLSARDADLRRQVVRVLGRMQASELKETFDSMLQDPDRGVRREALKGLMQLNTRLDVGALCELLRDPDLSIQAQAIDAIVQLNAPGTVEHLLGPLQDEAEYVRRAAVEVLNAIADASAIKDLLIAIKDQDWWVRERAADALIKIGGRRVIDAMLELIADDDPFVRRTAIEVINANNEERAFDHLINALADTDWWVRERALDALADLGDPKAVPHLLAMLDRDPDARPIVVRALGQLGDQSAMPQLIRCLQDPDKGVRREAIDALARLVDPLWAERVRHALRERARDSDPELREMAERRLTEIDQRLAPTASSGARRPAAVTEGGTDTEGLDPTELRPGEWLARRYQVIRRIGKGTFGTVVLVEDAAVGEQVVLKFINPQFATDDVAIQRFIHELRYARRVTHENVVRIYDLIDFGAVAAISMEYLAGHSLADELRGDAPLDVRRALALAQQVAAGMGEAHRMHVVHRDLKPANILIDEADRVKVVDFGIAAMADSTDTRLTRTGLVIGTPTYMSPEQITGRTVDYRTDIYSLGIILYEMLGGRPPYQGEDHMALMYQHLRGEAQPLNEVNDKVGKGIAAMVRRAMAVNAENRYQSMGDLRDRLGALADIG